MNCDVERLDTELNKRSSAPCCDGHTQKCHSVIVLRLPCAVSQKSAPDGELRQSECLSFGLWCRQSARYSVVESLSAVR